MDTRLSWIQQSQKIIKKNSKWFKKGRESVQITPCDCEEYRKAEEHITEEVFNKIITLLWC
jgi:uncharacterized membrane protein YvbJ